MFGLIFCDGENKGAEVYPAYMTKEQRQSLRDYLGGNKRLLRCSCREDKYLFYYVSSDLRFVPAEQFYEHKEGCSRSIGSRITYSVDDSGQIRVQLKFNPLLFSTPKITNNETEEDPLDATVPEDKSASEEEFIKYGTKNNKKSILERPLTLESFVQKLTYDALNDRMLSNKPVLSTDYFNTHLYARCKRVSIGGMKKSLRELSLVADKTAFLFGKLLGFNTTDSGAVFIKVEDVTGKHRSFFIFLDTLEKERVRFYNRYGKTLEEAMALGTVMAAGFCYRKYNRLGKEYTVFGRVCFYLESGGIYLSSYSDVETFSLLLSYCRDVRLGIYILVPPMEEVPFIKLCFKGQACVGRIYFDRAFSPPDCPYLELKGKELTSDLLNELIHYIKR